MKYISKEEQEAFHRLHIKIAKASQYLRPYICSTTGKEFTIVIKDYDNESISCYDTLKEAWAFAEGLETINEYR